jgi:hypothetical protein
VSIASRLLLTSSRTLAARSSSSVMLPSSFV